MTAVSPPALAVTGLSVRYGGVQAVDDLTITVGRGQIVGLIGPNGAGKTSALDGISGFTRISGGRIEVAGRDVTGWPTHRRVRAGLARTFQQLEMSDDLSLRDNLTVAAHSAKTGAKDRIDAALDLFDLGDCVDRVVSTLPQGRRRLAAVARAFVTDPAVLLLDEPAAGLDPSATEDLQSRLVTLAEAGTAVLLVEHDMALVMETCAQVVVINFGVTIGVGTPEEIRANRRVVEAYLGEVADA